MKKSEKNKLTIRVICLVLSALMVFGMAYTGIYYLFFA